jgi:hypothetical protein
VTYCQHQRNATRLACSVCQKPYDVSNATAAQRQAFICAWCASGVQDLRVFRNVERVTDVNGVPMTDP